MQIAFNAYEKVIIHIDIADFYHSYVVRKFKES